MLHERLRIQQSHTGLLQPWCFGKTPAKVPGVHREMPFQSLWHMQIKPNCHHIHAYEQSIHTHTYTLKNHQYISKDVYTYAHIHAPIQCVCTKCMSWIHYGKHCSPVQFQCSWPQLFNDGFIQLRLCFDRATQIFVAVFWRAINLWDENLQR